MAYTRQNFKDGQCLCAHNLQKMEDALCDMPCIEKAKAGQVLAVAEVDETGKPKRYEAVNVESGGGGGAEEIYVGTSEPTDPDIKIWVDPNEESDTDLTAESIKEALGYNPANEEDIPTVPTKVSAFTNDAGYAKKTELPTVPTKVSAFTNDANYAKKSELPTVPTKVSAFENDKGYITAEDIPEGGGTNADWSQNDPDAADYVKNRTHWVEHQILDILPETAVTLSNYQYMTQGSVPIVLGEFYTVTYDGIEYECECKSGKFSGMDFVGLGNASITDSSQPNTGEPFGFGYISGMGMWGVFGMNGAHTIKITGKQAVYHKLKKEFVPDNVYYIELEGDTFDELTVKETPAELINLLSEGKELKARWVTTDNNIGTIIYTLTNFRGVNSFQFMSFIKGKNTTTLFILELIRGSDNATPCSVTQTWVDFSGN